MVRQPHPLTMSPVLALLTFVIGLAAGWWISQQRSQRLRREAFIREYVFARSLFDALLKKHPTLTEKDLFLVARALRSFFLVHLRTQPATIGMPSRVVDDLWHEFILDTQAYHRFCDQAFGAYFHHVPAAKMEPGVSQDTGLRRTWRQACLEENIDPRNATRLPLLFAIDAKLAIVGGSIYSLTPPAAAAQGSSCGGGCGGFACSGKGLAGGSDSDGGSGGDGGGDGGGCGGGGGGD